MPQSLVTIDLETTGIDSTQDSVIEIGAVRFRGNRIESEFQTLVNPRRPIPNEVIELTGITNAMVASAPTLREVLPKLLMFVGNDAIVGHNVMFDLGFLRQAGIFNQNLPVDTFEVANVLLPNAPRYGLGTLVQFLGIPLPATHRALDDARATTALYQELYRRALALPLDVLADLVRLTEDVEWYGAWLFEEALRERRSEVLPRITAQPALYQQPPIEGKPLLQREETHPLDLDDLTAVFNADGHFAHLFPQYEIRPQQIEMMQAVAQAFSEPHHLLVEAGTGTGKSMAYLVPAIHWATQNQQRVLISTNTINLQDQLVEKDLPNLQQGLGIDFQYALLKGRSNYLCPRRLEQLRNKRNHSADEVRFLGKLRIWMQHTTTGDRGELNLPLATDRDLWQKISAEDEHCTHESCAVRMAGTCPFYRARRAAERAHLLVVNHSLLLADIAAENRVLPEYRYLVIDEAHHLESATTDGLTFTARQVDFERLLRELGGANSGTLGSLLGSLANSIPPDAYAALTVLVDQIQGGLTFALPHSVAFF
jgi:ATP-dependent DNA helicase DinG